MSRPPVSTHTDAAGGVDGVAGPTRRWAALVVLAAGIAAAAAAALIGAIVSWLLLGRATPDRPDTEG